MAILRIFLLFSLFLSGCTVPKPAPVESRSISKQKKAEEVDQVLLKKKLTSDGFYIIQKGDTLFGIALTFGQNWRDIALWNNITNPNKINVGKKLKVGPPNKTAGAVSIPLDENSENLNETGVINNLSSNRVVKIDKLDKDDVAVEGSDLNNSAISLSWVWPANGQVIQKFSESNSKGITIAGISGESIYAVSDGKVVYSGNGLRGYGNLVILKHNEDFITAYAHNQSIFVKEGESVSKGQKIAEMGMSEADRPKLLFEVRKAGKPLDPLRFLPSK
jgi:lipoprotein NlpD